MSTPASSLLARVASMPDATVRTVLDELALLDPAIWCMYYRRLRNYPLTFNVAKLLTTEALAKLRVELPDPRKYEHEYKSRLLRHRPFLVEPMRDLHPHKVYRKARQVGISELSISEALFFLWTNANTKWIYTFPRDTQLKDFCATRINPALDETPRTRQMMTGTNQVYLKQIGQSYLILRSAWESNLGEGIDADGVTLDEKDRMKPGVDIAFRESLSSSKYGLLREVSTPTLPGQGVDAPFQESDQRAWFMRCTRCGLEQEIEYPDNIIQVADIPLGNKELPEGCYEYLCRKSSCRGAIDRMHGRWIAKHPEKRMIHGYSMPQTIAPWITATGLMQKKMDYKFLQLWTNYCLGMPAMGENVLLSDVDFMQASAGHPYITRRTRDWNNICVGIDWGHLNWCVVMANNVHTSRPYIINIGIFEDDHANELASVKAIESFIAPYQPDMIIADAGYGKDRNAYLLRKFSPNGAGKVYACLDEHTKVATLDAQGWRYIKDMRVGDWTYAWNGRRVVPTRVTEVHDNGVKPVVRVVCRDGNGREKDIICTLDHEFMMREGGKREAGTLKPGDRLVPFGRWKTKGGKYRAINPTNRSKQLVYEHRLVKSRAKIVHHLDHNGCNNVPENLHACSSAKQHRETHPIKMPASWLKKMQRKWRDEGNPIHTPTAKAKAVAVRAANRRKHEENHVVVLVEPAGDAHVWDLTVDHEAHNFAIDDGVFVGNCWYNPSTKASRTFQPVWSAPDAARLLVDRTMTIKLTCHAIKEREFGLPSLELDKVQLLCRHFKNLAPLRLEEEGEIVEEISATGDDHLVHATAYAYLGFDAITKMGRFAFDFV